MFFFLRNSAKYDVKTAKSDKFSFSKRINNIIVLIVFINEICFHKYFCLFLHSGNKKDIIRGYNDAVKRNSAKNGNITARYKLKKRIVLFLTGARRQRSGADLLPDRT